jgi:hypothetical protein
MWGIVMRCLRQAALAEVIAEEDVNSAKIDGGTVEHTTGSLTKREATIRIAMAVLLLLLSGWWVCPVGAQTDAEAFSVAPDGEHTPPRRRFYLGEHPWCESAGFARPESMREIDGLCTRLFQSQHPGAYVRPTEVEVSGDTPPRLIGLRFDLFHDCYCDCCGGDKKALLTDDDMDIIARYTSLESLELYGAEITNAGLAKLTNLSQLRRLFLGGTRVDGKGLPLLANFPKLEVLQLPGGLRQAAELVPLVQLKNLQRVGLSTHEIEGRPFEIFAQLPQLRRLPYAPRSNEELKQIAGFKHLESLATIPGTIDDQGMVHIGGLTSLTHLGLSPAPITDAGLAELSQLVELKWLSLSQTNITDEGLRHLSQMKKLETLELEGTKVTDAGLQHLRSLTSLRQLVLPKRKFDGQGLGALGSDAPLQKLGGPLQIDPTGVDEINRLKNWQVLDLVIAGPCPQFEISDQPHLQRLKLHFHGMVGELRIVNCPRLEPIEIHCTRHSISTPFTVERLHLERLLRAGEIIDGESVAIKDGVFGCEGQWGAEWRVPGCDEACGQREVSMSFQSWADGRRRRTVGWRAIIRAAAASPGWSASKPQKMV